MSKFKELSWFRIGAESVAIVASILVAFSIDAWWDERQSRSEETRRLARVMAELETNAEIIREKSATLSAARDAAYLILSWLGPEPESVDQQTFVTTFDRAFSIGTFALTRNAIDDYLAAGLVDTTFSIDIRQAIARWDTLGDLVEIQYSFLRDEYRSVWTYLIDTVPIQHLHDVDEMTQKIESRFPFDHLALMSEFRFESHISSYQNRMEVIVGGLNTILARQADLAAQIENSIGL